MTTSYCFSVLSRDFYRRVRWSGWLWEAGKRWASCWWRWRTPYLKLLTYMWQGPDLVIGEQCSGFFPGRSYQWQKENSVTPKGISPSVTYRVNESSYQVRERWPPFQYWIERDWSTTQEEQLKEMHVTRITYGRPGRPLFFWIFIFPTGFPSLWYLYFLVTLHLSYFSQTYSVGCVLFIIILRCVISMTYCPLVFILLSQFYLFFNHCLIFSSFLFGLAQICLLFIFISAVVLFSQHVSFSEFIFLILKICSRIYLFLFPPWSLFV